jgi:hypothetical protein
MLTTLLENKLAYTRNSSTILTSNTLPIKEKDGTIVENINEVKNILTSLENKGIIVIDQIETIPKQDQEQKPITEKNGLDEIEKLNIMYILGRLSDSEYEKSFANALSKLSREGSPLVLPLTLIKKYLNLINDHLAAISNVNFTCYDEIMLKPELKKSNFTIMASSATFISNILNILREYIDQVKNIVGNSGTSYHETKIFIYLYPFIQPFVEKVRKRVNATEGKQIEQIKKEIQIEKEIISVLELLKEDERKIEPHRRKLRELKNELKDLKKYEEREVYVLIPALKKGKTFSTEDLLVNMFGKPPEYIMDTLREFTNVLHSTVVNHLLGNTRKGREGKWEIDLQLALDELQRGYIKIGDQLIVKVSLTWMNEFCPAMQDSTIDSEGRELELCKNPECFVVYHKKCLESLREAGVHSCLVCGKPIR